MILVASSSQDPFNQPLLEELGDLAQPYPLPNGDAVFVGLWEGSQAVPILIERKRVLDFVNSVVRGHHLQQIQDGYRAGFRFQYLIVEGGFREAEDSGLTEIMWGRKWTLPSELSRKNHLPDIEYARLENYLNQLELYLGIRSKRSLHVKETAAQVRRLYYLFQTPPEEHQTFRGLYQRAVAPPVDTASFLQEPPLRERIAFQLPGVGYTRGKAIAEYFGTTERLCWALFEGHADEFEQVPGIGKAVAKRIVETAVRE